MRLPYTGNSDEEGMGMLQGSMDCGSTTALPLAFTDKPSLGY